MTFAWGVLIPVGIILALFYKVVWPNGHWFYVSSSLLKVYFDPLNPLYRALTSIITLQWSMAVIITPIHTLFTLYHLTIHRFMLQ